MPIKDIRIACTALGKRIKAGYPAADGRSFKGEPVDVTSDCLKSVIEFVSPGYEAMVNVEGKPTYAIRVLDARTLTGSPPSVTEMRDFLAHLIGRCEHGDINEECEDADWRAIYVQAKAMLASVQVKGGAV